MATDLLLEFLLLLTLLFFIPQIINSVYRIPHPLIEVLLGVIAGFFAAQYFSASAVVQVLSGIGIMTLFVHAGLEADITFIKRHKRVFIENLLIFISFFLILTIATRLITHFTFQVSMLVSLALATPSAGYILSTSKQLSSDTRRWIESKALAAEIAAILLLAIVLSIKSLKGAALAFGVIVGLILVLPKLLRLLFRGIFSKLAGSEFPFILVITLLSAYLTEAAGLHFLVGAFIAGFVAKQFISEFASDRSFNTINKRSGRGIIEGFGFFAATFAPFYFFSAGLKLTKELFSWPVIAFAVATFAVVCMLRLLLMVVHRRFRIHESRETTLRVSLMLTPTLVFTFVIAEILHTNFAVSATLFGVLMLYGILTCILPLVALWKIQKLRV